MKCTQLKQNSALKFENTKHFFFFTNGGNPPQTLQIVLLYYLVLVDQGRFGSTFPKKPQMFVCFFPDGIFENAWMKKKEADENRGPQNITRVKVQQNESNVEFAPFSI